MSDITKEKLRTLLANARTELQSAVGSYGALLEQLSLLERSLEAGDLSDEVLGTALRAFPVRMVRVRGAAPASDGLKESRKLLVELNHLVDLRRQRRA